MGKAKEKVNRGYRTSQVILASFAFGCCMVFWSIYNSYVPLILDAKLTEMSLAPTMISTMTGAIMTIDNIFGLIFQPIFGARSDHMRSRFGKRMPYVIVGILVCSALFVLIPIMAKIAGLAGILAMMTVIIAFNFVMSSWRAPCVAIMPDMVPVEYQSDGNAIVNMVSVVFSIIATSSAAILGLMGFREAINSGDYVSVFAFASIIAILCLIVLLTCVKWVDNRNEKARAKAEQKEKKQGIRDLNLPSDVLRSMLFMMLALFFISGASDGFGTYFTLYATKNLGMNATTATMLRTVSSLGGVLLAIPAGIVGRKLGRKKTINIGLSLAVLMHLIMFITPYGKGLSSGAITGIMAVSNFIYAGAFIMININTLPIMLAIGGKARFGAFTGFYYTATFTAAVVSPILIGLLIGLTQNYNMLHVFCLVAMALALLSVYQVRHGEHLNEEEESALQDAVKDSDND